MRPGLQNPHPHRQPLRRSGEDFVDEPQAGLGVIEVTGRGRVVADIGKSRRDLLDHPDVRWRSGAVIGDFDDPVDHVAGRGGGHGRGGARLKGALGDGKIAELRVEAEIVIDGNAGTVGPGPDDRVRGADLGTGGQVRIGHVHLKAVSAGRGQPGESIGAVRVGVGRRDEAVIRQIVGGAVVGINIDTNAPPEIGLRRLFHIRGVLIDIDVAAQTAQRHGGGAAARRAVVDAAFVLHAFGQKLARTGGGVDQVDDVGVVVIGIHAPVLVEEDGPIGAGVDGGPELHHHGGAGQPAIRGGAKQPVGGRVDAIDHPVDRVGGKIDGVHRLREVQRAQIDGRGRIAQIEKLPG